MSIARWTLAVLAAGFLVAPTFAAPPHSLPPGLEKKAARGDLPPGWQKKLAVGHRLDRDVYHHAQVIHTSRDRDIVTVQIEDRRLRLLAETLEIIDILN
ncbi:hypothetical protein I6N98_12400 [Spongiibacter nanhainus]|uniref:PepSY domain-containing protein n=1 Tax=Spongiibacter nanhainus TaxID=2794344 RepID=A0A7T4UP08_9GAMM|nr:hypothetical protein [Spongiibacter nanhainus]QQD17163.1 hypothetical protein I6N98_12400 [Spongiibacter nanhainus]